MMVGNILFAYLKLRILSSTANMILCVFSYLILQGVYVQNVNANNAINAADGLSFGEPVNLTNILWDSVYAQVATQGNNVYIAAGKLDSTHILYCRFMNGWMKKG